MISPSTPAQVLLECVDKYAEQLCEELRFGDDNGLDLLHTARKIVTLCELRVAVLASSRKEEKDK